MTSQARPVRAPLSCHRSMPASPVERRFCQFGFALLGVWLLATVVMPIVMSSHGLPVDAHGIGRLHPHGHPFVDARVFWGIPNFMDVLTNVPLLLGGLWGAWALRGQRLPGLASQAVNLFFAGLVLTGLCSAWYHWSPDPGGLVLERLGMAVTFAGALALAVSERVGLPATRMTLSLALVVALLSAVMPLSHGNVWPWAVVQFGGMALMLWLALQKPVAGAMGVRIGWLIALYALAKCLELGDEPIFHATGEWVSGHSLKHVVAALAVWPVIAAVRQNAQTKPRRNHP